MGAKGFIAASRCPAESSFRFSLDFSFLVFIPQEAPSFAKPVTTLRKRDYIDYVADVKDPKPPGPIPRRFPLCQNRPRELEFTIQRLCFVGVVG